MLRPAGLSARIVALILLGLTMFGSASSFAVTDPGPDAANSASDGSSGGPLSQSGPWWEQSPWDHPDRSFEWYPPDRDKAVPAEQQKPPETVQKPKPKRLEDITDMEELQKEFKRRKDKAVLNATEENVKEFLEANQFIMKKSALFADVARRTVWAEPDLNYNVRSSSTSYGKDQQNRRVAEFTKKRIKDLSADHGLLFFARSDCPVCHDEAPILKGFSSSTGMQVMTITMDGGVIPMFPDAKKDNGISFMVTGGKGVEVFPSLYLLDRKTLKAYPLGVGVIAADEIAERIRVLTSTVPGEEF